MKTPDERILREVRDLRDSIDDLLATDIESRENLKGMRDGISEMRLGLRELRARLDEHGLSLQELLIHYRSAMSRKASPRFNVYGQRTQYGNRVEGKVGAMAIALVLSLLVILLFGPETVKWAIGLFNGGVP